MVGRYTAGLTSSRFWVSDPHISAQPSKNLAARAQWTPVFCGWCGAQPGARLVIWCDVCNWVRTRSISGEMTTLVNHGNKQWVTGGEQFVTGVYRWQCQLTDRSRFRVVVVWWYQRTTSSRQAKKASIVAETVSLAREKSSRINWWWRSGSVSLVL